MTNRNLEEEVCYLKRENEILQKRLLAIEAKNIELQEEVVKRDKHSLILIEGNQITILD